MTNLYKIRKFKVYKEDAYAKNSIHNEDLIRIVNHNNHFKVILLDGASESFASKNWTWRLRDQFAKPFDFSYEQTRSKILKAAEEYRNEFAKESLSWSQQVSFNRGSFCTIIVFECNKISGNCRYLCIGDSSIFVRENSNVVMSIPYNEYSMYAMHPYLVSSKIELNSFIDNKSYKNIFYGEFNLSCDKNYNILLMTDAISAWLMKEKLLLSTRYEKLVAISKRDELSSLVEQERKIGNLKTDDTSVVSISVINK